MIPDIPAGCEKKVISIQVVDSQGNKVEIETKTRKSINLSASGISATRLVVVLLDSTHGSAINGARRSSLGGMGFGWYSPEKWPTT
jgi:hypothetical protein